MKKRVRRTYENPFVVYNRLGKNFVYDNLTKLTICIVPEELGFQGISKYLEKHFKNLKSWREVVLSLEKHNRKYGDKCFTYPKKFEQIQDSLTTEYDNKIEELFEEFFENGYEVIKPKVFRLKLKRV